MNIMPIISKMNRVEHTLEPLYNKESRTLILGSMPSVASRARLKYYGHPSNRFWMILERVYETQITDWKSFILDNHLALWDVIASCDINSSSDASIKNVKVNDIKKLLDNAKIENIFVLGKTAYKLYNKYIFPTIKRSAIVLPSPSSANARMRLEDLVEEYKIIRTLTIKSVE